jgi:hypothetical protein
VPACTDFAASLEPENAQEAVTKQQQRAAASYHPHPPASATRATTGAWETGPRAGQLGPQAALFRAPCYMQHKLNGKEKRGIETMVVVYAVPTLPGQCRLINRNTFKFYNSKLPELVFKVIPQWFWHVSAQVGGGRGGRAAACCFLN